MNAIRLGSKRFVRALLLISACCLSAPGQADPLSVSAVPTGWLVQNYVPDSPVLWFTGSVCVNGQLVLPASGQKADRDRLFAMLLLAKTTGKKVQVWYDYTPGNPCFITSFGLMAE